MRKIDITGQKFSRLTAIKKLDRINGRYCWLFECECGKIKVAEKYDVEKGKIQSCGCLKGEKHGMANSKEYKSWQHMKDRCLNPKHKNYSLYGGRGIKICDRWKSSFKNFLEDMGHRPNTNCSLDRIDNNGNYEPSNCRWVNQRVQCNNKNNNVKLVFNNETRSITDWSRELDISYGSLVHHHSKGRDLEFIINYKKQKENYGR